MYFLRAKADTAFSAS